MERLIIQSNRFASMAQLALITRHSLLKWAVSVIEKLLFVSYLSESDIRTM